MEDKEKIEFQEGIKPVPGIPSNFGQGTTIFQTDDEGNITRIKTSGAPLDTRNVKTKEEYENPVRIGDYYYAPDKTIQVWKNSPTDILQKSRVAVGGTEAPVNTVSLKNEGLGALSGAAIGKMLGPGGALVGALAGGLLAHNNAAEEALKQWQEQDVKYDSAVEFYKDDDGTIKYQFDYDKMGTGGPRSGEAVKEAQNRETEVRLGDDGRLKVKVSPIFASTERFQEIMNYISENYGGLSKDTENLDEVLTEIKNGIDGEAKSYVSNMKLYADFAHRFPNASPETIVASYTTEVSGYVKPDEMKDYQVSVLDGDKITTKTAKEFFDSVLKMDKGQRNELAKKLNDIVYGNAEGYDDNKRAIAYGELQSMFVASANTEKHENDPYQGMMDADPFVSFLDNFAPLGLNGADVVSFLSGGNFSKQEYLNQDDFAEFLGGAAGIGAGFGLWEGGTKLAEGALKWLPGSAQLFNASVSGMGREGLAAAIAAGRTGDVAKMWAAELGFKTLKIGTFDAALAGAQTAVSGKDFWTEFGQDFARDAALEAVVSYYDMIQFQKYVTDTNVYVYRDVKTGNLKKEDTYRGNAFTAYDMSDDGLLTETSYEQVAKVNVVPTGEGKGASVIQTPQGTTVEIVNGKIRYTPGKTGVVEGTVVEETATEFQSLSTGVVSTKPTDETDALRKALEREGLPTDTEVFTMPSQQADAAIVAGKIAKAQGTKVGLGIYKQLFNKNAVLDMANNLALAKDGDLNAWRSAQEDFVSVSQKADDNLKDIQNGVYIKNAAQEWQNTLQVIGGFNYEFKYKSKTDGAYINAINQIQRAQLLNDSRPEGDTTDYVAKALEQYGDTINKMPQERAEALQGWLEQGKKWLEVFNQSVRKSGKVDVELLDSYTNTDIEAKIGYFPVWAKKTTYKGLLDNFYGLSQQRNPYKDWLRNGEWVPLEELEDPYLAMTRYMGFMANNMGLNDRNETAAKVMERADILVDNTPTDATIRKRKLDSIKNKDELTKKLDEMVEAKKKEVEEATLTPKQYNDAMTKIYEDSAIEETVDALNIDLSETKRYALQTDYDDGGSSLAIRDKRQKIVDLDEDIKITGQRIERYNNGISWGATKIPEDLDANAKKNLKKLQQQHVKDGKKAAAELGYTGGPEEFDVWSKNKLEQMKANRDDLVTEVLKVRGQERPTITFEGELYSSSEVPTEYIPKRSERQKISDDILGVWNSYNGGLANAWLNEGDASVKKELRDTIERNPKLRAALLSTMYDNSGSKLPYKEWLNTPITITRQQEVDSLRPEDAFLSFSMQKNWQGMGGVVPRLENVPGDIITLKVKPKDTLGEIPKGIEAEDEQEIIVPREVYATAMTGPEDVSGERWNDFWKNAPAQTRKDIRNELEKTSLQTGYGISDTRARLNAQVPGADVLDWSLLGRDHTNGLVPGGLYAGKSAPVKAYIMSIDDLVKLTGYDLDNAIPGMGKVIEDNINIKDIVPMLPAHIRGSGDGSEIWLKMRWGHNSDGVANWTDYLKTLKERGIEKVPVAFSDSRFDTREPIVWKMAKTDIPQKNLDSIAKKIDESVAKSTKLELTPREVSAASYAPGYDPFKIYSRIRRSIPQELFSEEDWSDVSTKALEYNWDEDAELNRSILSKDTTEDVISNKLGYVPQDITADVQQAFSENGQIPFFRGQYGMGDFNSNGPSMYPELIGDAYWIAPNASYTDSYGKDKIAGTIPVKYFMSDKEKNEIVKEISGKLSKFREKIKNKIQGNVEKALKSDQEPERIIIPSTAKEWAKLQKQKGIFAILEYEPHFDGDYIDYAGNLYRGSRRISSDGTHEDVLEPSGDAANPEQTVNLIVEGRLDEELINSFLTNREKKEFGKILQNGVIDKSGKIQSYRALAEYAKKPIIDISEDGFADGTAFFYYKGVDPEFDEEIGEQLEVQARGTQAWPEGLAEEMFDEWVRENTLGDFLNLIKEEAPESADNVNILLNELKDNILKGGIATKESNLIHKISQQIEEKHPELSHLAFVLSNRVWTVPKEYDLSTPLAEIGIDRNRFYAPYSVESFLEEIGEENPDYVTPEEKAAWDAVDPTNFANVPTEPQFRQPRIPTYEDYQKGLLADPNMARRIQESYRGALAQKLVKEASRVVGLAEDYLSAYSWGNDWQSYLNTSLIPDLKEAINQRMLPEEFKNFVQARMVQAIQDVAPYQSPELIMKSQLDNVAQEWREWAEKHIKAGRFTQKDLKDFVGSHNLELPNDKRPYPAKVKHALWQMVEDGEKLPKIEGLSTSKISRDMDKAEFYKMLDNTPLFQSAVKDKKELVDLVAAEKNGETIDGYTMGVSATALGLGGRYPWTWYKNGKPYTRFIKYDTPEKQRWAEEFVSLANDKELVREEGLISRFFSGTANDFRLLTTGWDPSRVYSNITRDTTRSFTIGKRFINTKNTLQSAIEMGDYTPKQKEILSKAIENAAKNAASASYNSAYRSPKRKQTSITKEYLSQTGASPMKRFMYNLVHDKRSIAEGPMEFFEGWSRRNNARSLAAVQLGKDQAAGLSFKKQLQNAVDAANFAGREYTANFQRKGKLIGRVSKYVAYQSSAYAGLDGMMRAFIDDPKTVSRNFAVFVIAYIILLADTLSREETRKQYYRLSEYDRENQIVIGMGDSILTIPMDQELAGLLYPYRAILETLEGVDQPSFFQFVWGTFTNWMPMDLSGFSEGDGFNLARGLEKLTAQNMPTGLTPIQEAATGYDLYYGNDISVSDETLKDYGIYDPQAGDYTTNSKDSLFLRNVANLTGIPQWQLQAMWEGYGGNVGKYVLNIIDKAAGATKEQQGGKDFADAVFGSMTALDQDAASSAFYDGLNQLKKEKNSLLQKIANYNEDLKAASGQAKVELQNKIQKAKEDYGIKVGDFVDKYVSAYDITGGLPKNQAQQIYYLFRLDDDDTIYESGSVEEYYQKQAQQKFKNQATALSAPILDKYYNNRIGNIYQDADGVWRRYLSGGAQAMRNSIYGHGEQQMVDLLNILEGKDSTLTDYRKKIKDARSKAYDAKDWDTRDALGYELDKKVIEAISPYIEKYGAENVLGNTQVLDYLSDWFIVPDDFIRSKKNKYVSLGNNASTQEAFVKPFIKYVFGLPTNFSSYRDAKYNSLEIGK